MVPIVHAAGDPADDGPRTRCGEANGDASRGKDDGMDSSTAGRRAPSETETTTPRSREQLNAELKAAIASKKKVTHHHDHGEVVAYCN